MGWYWRNSVQFLWAQLGLGSWLLNKAVIKRDAQVRLRSIIAIPDLSVVVIGQKNCPAESGQATPFQAQNRPLALGWKNEAEITKVPSLFVWPTAGVPLPSSLSWRNEAMLVKIWRFELHFCSLMKDSRPISPMHGREGKSFGRQQHLATFSTSFPIDFLRVLGNQ